MQARILSITARNGGEEILLRVEHTPLGDPDAPPETEELLLLTDRYMELKPTKGYIDEDFLVTLREAAEFSAAVQMGMRMLAFGANTKRALEIKLYRKGVARECAQAAAAYLSDRRYLCESDDAVREAERQVKKLRGRNRILAHLYDKGYGADAVKAAEEYLAEVDFTRLCRDLIVSRFHTLPSAPEERRRVAASMMRSGYNMREVRGAMALLEGEKNGADPD